MKKELRLSGTQDITTKRLDLRKFRSRDAENLFRWSSDENILKYFCNRELTSIEDAECVIASWRVQYENTDCLLWCIQEASTKQAIGKISANIDDKCSCADIEYLVAPDARGKGYAVEALRGVIKYLHEEVGVHRVQAYIHYDNIASMKTAEKAGMQWEGLLRDALIDRNKVFYDVALYAHIAE